MKILFQILTLIIVLNSCNQKQDFKVNLSNEDSIRISVGLIPLKDDWNLKSIEYGLIDSISHAWTKIIDTNSYDSFITKKRYVSIDKSGVVRQKLVDYNSKISKNLSETDIYVKYNADSTLKIDIIYSYNYISNTFYCTIDTLDIEKEKRVSLILDSLDKKEKESIKSGLLQCSTIHHNKIMKLMQSYLKVQVLSKDKAQVLIKGF